MNTLRRAVTAFLLLKLIVLILNLWQFPVLGRRPKLSPPIAAPPARPRPRVSLLVPMRNEAARLAASVPAILAQGADEIIMLDDESADGTGALARALVAEHPGARVADGVPAPPGWVGKNWACHQLAAEASSPLLVFCDADVLLAEGAIDAVITEMQVQRADVFSVFPRQITATLGEHLITPLIDDVLLCFLPFWLLSADVPQAATANGSLLAFTRPAYDDSGGFAAVRSELVEDVATARRVRKAGLKLGLALGGPLVATRMYHGYREVLAGMSRGLLPVTGGSRSRLVLGAGWHLLAYTLPWGLARRRRGWGLLLVLGVAERALVEIKTGRRTVWQAALTPLSPLAAAPIVARALRRKQRWKGRVYS
jgi:cellulose synthase/poly-beta-1,6-N-acetylglucosamine synthase-like glycosyltransferase